MNKTSNKTSGSSCKIELCASCVQSLFLITEMLNFDKKNCLGNICATEIADIDSSQFQELLVASKVNFYKNIVEEPKFKIFDF